MKHPVPKQKQSPSRSKIRYAIFERRVRTQLTNKVQLSTCPDCNAKHMAYHACAACGKYRGRQIIPQKQAAPIKTIKA